MLEDTHVGKLPHQLGKRNRSNRDGGQVNIIPTQSTSEGLDMLEATGMAAGSTGISHLQSTQVKPEGEIGKTTTIILIKPDNRQIRNNLRNMENKRGNDKRKGTLLSNKPSRMPAYWEAPTG